MQATLEFEHDATLGEGPVWDAEEEILYWIDILSGMLFVYDPHRKHNTAFTIGEHLGAVALREKGGVVMAMRTGFAFFNLENQRITPVADPESDLPDNRFNDGKCDPSGRFWAGSLSYELEEQAGSLYCLNDALDVEVKLSNMTLPNGMAWNKQNNQFFCIDSLAGKIFAFDYENRSGEISNRSVIRKIKKEEGIPDGMTTDEENGLWVALYGGGKVIRVDPVTGKTLFEVHLPAPQVTSCTFGGSDLDELYITTGRENMTPEQIAEAPLSGSLFKAKLPFRGRPPARFAG